MATPSTVVLTISRQMGAGGSYIGQKVAARLRLKYVDREILQEAARQLGTEDSSLERLEERVAGLWVRMTRHLSFGPPDALFTPPNPATAVYEEQLFRIERQIMREIASRENCVIIGRAGSIVLRDHPGIVRVFVHAPETWRMQNMIALGRQPEEGLLETIRRSDQDRARFTYAVCGCNWMDACHYDLCLRPALMGLDEAAELVRGVVESRMRAWGIHT